MEQLPDEVEAIVNGYKHSMEDYEEHCTEIARMLKQTLIFTLDRLQHYYNLDMWWESLPVEEKLRLINHQIPPWNLSRFREE